VWGVPRRGPTSPIRALRISTIIGGGSIAMERSLSIRPNAQSQTLVQALEAVGSWHSPDRGKRLPQALQHLWPLRQRKYSSLIHQSAWKEIPVNFCAYPRTYAKRCSYVENRSASVLYAR
jgi:hypothetical protein